jgi:hypothetical protein
MPDAGAMPMIALGSVQVSRLILGSNPFFGFSHKPDDTGARMCEFYTPERIMAVMDEAADLGITAVWTPCYDHWVALWNRYREGGGKLRTWIGQPDTSAEDMPAAIRACAANGGEAVCIQGERIDSEVRDGKWDLIRGWLDLIHESGMAAAISSHRPETHLWAEDRGLPTDFYHQCLYQPEDYSQAHRDAALATVAQLDKPTVAYKVFAAGRLSAQEALPPVLQALRPKDGVCVGVFPASDPGQLAQNAALVREYSAS